MNPQTITRNHIYVDGNLMEYWEDPYLPFRCTPDDLRSYVTCGDWVMLFNALVLLPVCARREDWRAEPSPA